RRPTRRSVASCRHMHPLLDLLRLHVPSRGILVLRPLYWSTLHPAVHDTSLDLADLPGDALRHTGPDFGTSPTPGAGVTNHCRWFGIPGSRIYGLDLHVCQLHRTTYDEWAAGARRQARD